MDWKSKLNKKELAHLRQHTILTLDDLKETRAWQLARKAEDHQPGLAPRDPCWECRSIAIKLGLEQ